MSWADFGAGVGGHARPSPGSVPQAAAAASVAALLLLPTFSGCRAAQAPQSGTDESAAEAWQPSARPVQPTPEAATASTHASESGSHAGADSDVSATPHDAAGTGARAELGGTAGTAAAAGGADMPADDLAADATDAGLPARSSRVSLIDQTRWTPLGPDEDPFEDRPDDVVCAPDALTPEYLNEELAYGVDTGGCHYSSARQSTAEPVIAGESLVVRLWHFKLDAPDPGEAHAVVEVDGLRLLDERIAIPAPGGLIRRVLPAPRAIPAGAPVHFHLHNHGDNSWALVELSTGP